MTDTNWKNFSAKELMCRCGKCDEDSWKNMNEEFMNDLQELRTEYNAPIVVTSAYRCKDHQAEASKKKPGTHCKGIAVDISVGGADAYELLGLAYEQGFGGIGVSQKDDNRFIHLDDRTKPMIWSY